MPIPMWPKMDHPGRREGSLVSTGRLLLHFLSIGARRPRASYTIPLNMIVRTTAMLFVNRLVHTLVPGSESEPVDASCRTNAGFSASLVCIGLNITLCLAKGIAGLLAGSVSLIADAFNNLSDASSNIVSLLGFRLARRPADEGHPYGHGRYEYLAGLFVAVLVCAVGINLILESVTKIIKPSPTAYTFISLAALATSMLVKLWMAAFNRTLGDRIDSDTLIATAQDSKNDVITSGSVLVAALISQTTGFDLDGWAGLGVGIFICISGLGLVRDAISPLLGQAPDPKLVQAIRDKIMSYPQVLGTHDLMVHDYGPVVSLPAPTWRCPARATRLSTTRFWTPSSTTSSARWALVSRCTATPSRQPAMTCAAGSSAASCRSIPRSPSTICTSTTGSFRLTWCVPTALTYPTRSCWSSSRASCTSADPMPHASLRLTRALARPTVRPSSCSPLNS